MDIPSKIPSPRFGIDRPWTQLTAFMATAAMVAAPFVAEWSVSLNDCGGKTDPSEVPIPDNNQISEFFAEVGAPESALSPSFEEITTKISGEYPPEQVKFFGNAAIQLSGRAFDSDYQITIADLSKPGVHVRAYEGENKETVGEHTGYADWSFAINGGYFTEGTILGPSITSGFVHGTEETQNNAFVGMTQSGELRMPHMIQKHAEKNPEFVSGVTGRTTIIYDGKMDQDGFDHDIEISKRGPIFTDKTLNCKDSRTVIGMNKRGNMAVQFTTISSKENRGMTAPEVAELLLSLGFVYRAVVLDGGGSSNAVTHTADGAIHSQRAGVDERPVANQIVIDINELFPPVELASA